MFYSDDEDDDFHPFFGRMGNPLGDFLLVQQMMRAQLLRERASPRGSNAFIKGWSTKEGDKRQIPSTQSLVAAKIATMFSEPVDGLTDLYIGAVGGPKIPAHQIVLASWSENMKHYIIKERLKWSLLLQNAEGHVESDGVLILELKVDKECAEVFEDFIRFMYTESISLNLKTVWPQIRLAAQHKVNELLETCIKFIFQRVIEIPISRSLEEVMKKATALGASKSVVQTTMQRILSELFLNESTTVSSVSVDLLCDVLRSSDVVALSEFDIFLKIKPKLSALRKAGKHRQVLRLLSLLRLTQMTSSQLREFSCTEYMDDMRKAFPGKLETALWTRAIYSEGSWEDVPVNIERPRLYLECPVPFAYDDHYEDYDPYFDREVLTRLKQLEVQPQKLKCTVLEVRNGEQQLKKEDLRSRYERRDQFAVYKVSNGEHGISRLPDQWTLCVPCGKFPVITVDIVKPKLDGGLTWKVVLVFYKTTHGQTSQVPTVSVFEGCQFTSAKIRCPIESLPTTSENFEVSIKAIGYAYEGGRTHFSQLIMESPSSGYSDEYEI